MKAHVIKLPFYTNDDMIDMVKSISKRMPNVNVTFSYKYNNKTDRMMLYCKCNLCKQLLGKYIVDDFGIPMKVLYEKEGHPCRPWRRS